MVNRERLELALADLVSGDYPQGMFSLRTGDGYCCLGVFCDRYRKETGDGRWEQPDGSSGAWIFRVNSYDSRSVLPLRVANWYGLAQNPALPPRTVTAGPGKKANIIQVAGGYNDHGVSFSDIEKAFRLQYLTEVTS